MSKIAEIIRVMKGRLSVFKKTPPITNFDEYCEFLAGNAAFITQKTLFGYVKTRMGISYPEYFKDDLFIDSLNIAKWNIYAASLADLGLFMAANLPGITQKQREKIAYASFEQAVKARFDDPEFSGDISQIIKDFKNRLALENWSHDGQSPEGAFRQSPEALVKWAPIADELKELDAPIVKNSIRFQWQRVRGEYHKALDGEAVLADWKSLL